MPTVISGISLLPSQQCEVDTLDRECADRPECTITVKQKPDSSGLNYEIQWKAK